MRDVDAREADDPDADADDVAGEPGDDGHCASTRQQRGSVDGLDARSAPSGWTPAFSSSCAPALSSTPVRSSEKVDEAHRARSREVRDDHARASLATPASAACCALQLGRTCRGDMMASARGPDVQRLREGLPGRASTCPAPGRRRTRARRRRSTIVSGAPQVEGQRVIEQAHARRAASSRSSSALDRGPRSAPELLRAEALVAD